MRFDKHSLRFTLGRRIIITCGGNVYSNVLKSASSCLLKYVLINCIIILKAVICSHYWNISYNVSAPVASGRIDGILETLVFPFLLCVCAYNETT